MLFEATYISTLCISYSHQKLGITNHYLSKMLHIIENPENQFYNMELYN